MRITTDHRATTQVVPLSAYRKAADEFVALTREADVYDSVIVCGSLIKNDIVIGWSDLDIICIAASAEGKERVIAITSEIYRQISKAYHIGIGLDLAWRDEFDRTSRIGGRPLAMTYEVAQYGEFHFRDAPLSSAAPVRQMGAVLKHEKALLALAEVHNWRRVRLQADTVSAHSRKAAATATKTLLKLLKIIVAPYNGKRFTHDEDLAVLCESVNGALTEPFEAAIELRANWMTGKLTDVDVSEVCDLTAKLDVHRLLDMIDA